MKKITSIFLLVAAFAMIFSVTTFAAAGSNTFTITTDKTAYTAGEEIVVTVTLTGDLKDAAIISTSIKFDSSKVTVDTGESRKYGMNCIDADWYEDLDADYENNLGYITAEPTPGENPTGTVNIAFLSTKGYTIDDECSLYSEDATTVSAKIKGTAVADIAAIDATYFEIVGCYVAKEDGTKNTATLVQLEVEEEADPVPVKKAVIPEALTTLVAEDANYTNVAIWKATFSGLQTKGATNIGYDFTKTGSDKNNGKVITTEISGDGDVVFVLALHGVSADEYGKLTFAPYYTVMEVPAN